MDTLTDKDSFPSKRTIEMSAYQNGIDLPAVLKVVGVKLRDKILRNFNIEAPQ